MDDPIVEGDSREVWAERLAYVLLFCLWFVCLFTPPIALWLGGPWCLGLTVVAVLSWIRRGPPFRLYLYGEVLASLLGISVLISTLASVEIALILIGKHFAPHGQNRTVHPLHTEARRVL